ncbi:hypothetical protein THMIRHAM_21230 [Thiomicrorhabdus immobilis]|uniref:Uncharacterized protein n=1 Tax=Thiomicrorhabdus immobilis TaxID=2791037 RepID=A0ABM7MFP2_9GAMM|nr:hypothetical protein [Thiomicrorhabdus immobilis]BCN94338.1 hypothetical protein THMIRHAM_21230 [Thiomicrorhabdus immobilis]
MKKNIDTLVWLTASQLNANHPVYEQIDGRVATLFIWDDEQFQKMGFSIKRQYFIWQCLQDFKKRNLMVIKGETDHVLKSIYQKTPKIKIITPEDKRLDYSRWSFINRLNQPQFLVYQGKIPYGFFKFWKQAEQQLFPKKYPAQSHVKASIPSNINQSSAV